MRRKYNMNLKQLKTRLETCTIEEIMGEACETIEGRMAILEYMKEQETIRDAWRKIAITGLPF